MTIHAVQEKAFGETGLHVDTLRGSVIGDAADTTAKTIEHPLSKEILQGMLDNFEQQFPDVFAEAEQLVEKKLPEIQDAMTVVGNMQRFYDDPERGAYRKEHFPPELIQQNAGIEDDTQRVVSAEKLLGFSFSEQQKTALLKAHVYGGEKDVFNVTSVVGGRKLQILLEGGFTQDQAWELCDSGHCGFWSRLDKQSLWLLNAIFFGAAPYASGLYENIPGGEFDWPLLLAFMGLYGRRFLDLGLSINRLKIVVKEMKGANAGLSTRYLGAGATVASYFSNGNLPRALENLKELPPVIIIPMSILYLLIVNHIDRSGIDVARRDLGSDNLLSN